MERFFTEVRRSLTPTGTLAIWGYGIPTFPEHPDLDQVGIKYHTEVIGPFWDEQRAHVDDHYQFLRPHLPFPRHETIDMHMDHTMTIDALVGYYSTSSALATMRKSRPDLPDPLPHLRSE